MIIDLVMNGDHKNRIGLKRLFPDIEEGDLVNLAVLGVDGDRLLYISKEAEVIRNKMIDFLNEYLGEGNFSKDFVLKGAYLKKVDKSARIVTSDVLKKSISKISLTIMNNNTERAVYIVDDSDVLKESIVTTIKIL